MTEPSVRDFWDRMFQPSKQEHNSRGLISRSWSHESQPERIGVMTLYIDRYPQELWFIGWALKRLGVGARGGRGAWWPPVEKFSSKKQRYKSLNMESQRRLRKIQYSSPPTTVSASVVSLLLSHTFAVNFDPFQK